MKRFVLAASLFVFAACSPKAEEAAPADTAAPAVMTDSMAHDTTKADSTADTTATKM